MAKRPRSPNYPAISLPESLDRLGKLWESIGKNPAPREIVATGLGYSGLHGASATAVSAVSKYGLLERQGSDLKISERGMMCLHPQGPVEREGAIRDAALEPALFAELKQRFPGGTSNEELLRNYLIRMGFTPTAASNALLSYHDTVDLVEREGGGYDTASSEAESESTPMMGQADVTPIDRGRVPEPVSEVAAPLAGKFRVSMTDEFFVDVSASRLDQAGVKRLIEWLKANEGLVPAAVASEDPSEQTEQ